MTEKQYKTLHHLLSQMPSITLDEMSSIRLMNRTDYKYVTHSQALLKVIEKASDEYLCQEIDDKRIAAYRTVYLDDTDSHTFYNMHHCLRTPRLKVRARTYLDSQLSFLEVKSKNNHGKTSKVRTKIPSIAAVVENNFGKEFIHRELNINLHDLQPTLGNRFHRITLVNHAKTERLTIDFNLEFDNFENQNCHKLDKVCIIELKRSGKQPSPILNILRELRIKPLGFSKYLIGSALTNQNLRKNLIKERLHAIRKAAELTYPLY